MARAVSRRTQRVVSRRTRRAVLQENMAPGGALWWAKRRNVKTKAPGTGCAENGAAARGENST
ncbi:hypothetical protein CAURIC_03145 [Corynebacterium auriscanis]|nr:hypothetical protein CAURIC_03145 [Corynebacterium auriscanis]